MIGWNIFGGIVLLIAAIMLIPVVLRVDMESERETQLRLSFAFIRLFYKTDDPKYNAKKEKQQKRRAEKEKKKQEKADKKQAKKAAKSGETEIAQISNTDKSNTPLTPDSEKDVGDKKDKKDKNSKKTEKDTETAENPEGTEESDTKKQKSKVDFALIKTLIDSAGKPTKRIFLNIRVEQIYIDCVVGGDDAAKVAINYGTYCGLLYGLINWLGATFKVKAKEVNIEADFDREKTDWFMHAVVKMRIGTVMYSLFWFGVRFLKRHLKSNKTKAGARKKQRTA